MCSYHELAEKAEGFIKPFEACKCGEKVLVTIAVEPVDSEFFKTDRPQHCNRTATVSLWTIREEPAGL